MYQYKNVRDLGIAFNRYLLVGFPSGREVKNLPTMHDMQETWVPSLGREDSPEKGMAIGPVFLPGKSHGQRNMAGYRPCGHKEADTTQVSEHSHYVRGMGHLACHGR